MKTKDLVLQSIKHCKMFAPIATEMGIESDDKWITYNPDLRGQFHDTPDYNYEPSLKVTELLSEIVKQGMDYGTLIEEVPTWRQDKLELPLPAWCFKENRLKQAANAGYSREFTKEKPLSYWDDFIGKVKYLLRIIFSEVGEQKRIATVELVCLLKKENLL